jgi:glycine/D-amino acid oxidase-like deaminating enzyme
MAATGNAAAEASHSLWMDVAAFPAQPLERSIRTEVAIVGSGICGVSLAYELTAKGVAVAVLDRGEIARGMSSRTTAHLAFQSDDLYREVVSRRGERTAKLHYQASEQPSTASKPSFAASPLPAISDASTAYSLLREARRFRSSKRNWRLATNSATAKSAGR